MTSGKFQWCTLRLETGLVCMVQSALSLKLPLRISRSHFECLRRHSCFSSACIVNAVKFNVTPRESSVSPLSESYPSPRNSLKEISVSLHVSHFIQVNARQLFQVHFSSSRLCVRQIEIVQQSTVGQVSQLRIRAAGGHGTSLSSFWPRQRCTKSLGSDIWLSKRNKKIPQPVPAFQHCSWRS